MWRYPILYGMPPGYYEGVCVWDGTFKQRILSVSVVNCDGLLTARFSTNLVQHRRTTNLNDIAQHLNPKNKIFSDHSDTKFFTVE